MKVDLEAVAVDVNPVAATTSSRSANARVSSAGDWSP
jgi:hypothetical protein